MALLRQCLQELRTKHRDWDGPAGAWPEPKPVLQRSRPGSSLLVHGDRGHRAGPIASQRPSTA